VRGKPLAEAHELSSKQTIATTLDKVVGDLGQPEAAHTVLAPHLKRTVGDLTTDGLEGFLKASPDITRADTMILLRHWEDLRYERAFLKRVDDWEIFTETIQKSGRPAEDAELATLSEFADAFEARKSIKPLTDVQQQVLEARWPPGQSSSDLVAMGQSILQGQDPFVGEKLRLALLNRLNRGFVAGERNISAGELFDALESIKALKPGTKVPIESSNVLRRVFGDTEQGKRLHGIFTKQSNWALIGDLVNIPRSAVTSVDMSATLRQAWITFTRRPVTGVADLMRGTKAAVNRLYAEELDSWVRTGRRVIKELDEFGGSRTFTTGQKGKDHGVFLVQSGERLALREEAYMSSWAERVMPWVRVSQRGYNTQLNLQRVHFFDGTLAQWYDRFNRRVINLRQVKAGKASSKSIDTLREEMEWARVSDKDIDGLAQATNFFTGRGKLGFAEGTDVAAVASNVFFSPRLNSSRIAILQEATVGTARTLGKVALKRTLTKVDRVKLDSIIRGLYVPMAGYGALYTAQKQGWLPDFMRLEINPFDEDFGKVSFGDSRIDIWAGMLPFARLFARTFEELAFKPVIKGEAPDLVRLRKLWLEDLPSQKLQPVGGFLKTVIVGEDFLGRPFKYDEEDFFNLFVGLFTPLSIDATLESMSINSMWDVLGKTGLPGSVGLESDDVDINFRLEQLLSSVTGEVLGFGSVTFRDFAEELHILRDEHHAELNTEPGADEVSYDEGTIAS
ncbi:hypothetical protein LCGC14_2009990, partial [marine sediment metagenome]